MNLNQKDYEAFYQELTSLFEKYADAANKPLDGEEYQILCSAIREA
jgi:hypothetical protein